MASQDNKSLKIGIYAGTFDPITNGHLDIIKKSLSIVDILYVAIATDSIKKSLFTVEERINMVLEEININQSHNIKVESFSGLVVNYAKTKNASLLIRGMRTVSDFDFEFQMAAINSMLDSELQTIFIPASQKLQLVSSTFAKEIIKLDGDSKYFLSKNIKNKLSKKLKE